jgi:ABC-type antimicrobial peptide transport system permease subunit
MTLLVRSLPEMMHPLVEQQLRQNVQQTVLNALGIALSVIIMLTLAGTTFVPVRSPITTMIVLRVTIAAMIWLALAVAVLFVAINRFSQVRERTRQFAILKVLGASFSFIAFLLFQETVIVTLSGLLIGILLAEVGSWLIAYTLPHLFASYIPYESWLLAGIVSAAVFFFAGILSAWIVTSRDLLEALSDKE